MVTTKKSAEKNQVAKKIPQKRPYQLTNTIFTEPLNNILGSPNLKAPKKKQSIAYSMEQILLLLCQLGVVKACVTNCQP
jgi:hypothetical protein